MNTNTGIILIIIKAIPQMLSASNILSYVIPLIFFPKILWGRHYVTIFYNDIKWGSEVIYLEQIAQIKRAWVSVVSWCKYSQWMTSSYQGVSPNVMQGRDGQNHNLSGRACVPACRPFKAQNSCMAVLLQPCKYGN